MYMCKKPPTKFSLYKITAGGGLKCRIDDQTPKVVISSLTKFAVKARNLLYIHVLWLRSDHVYHPGF